jgi:hypothetical protein
MMPYPAVSKDNMLCKLGSRQECTVSAQTQPLVPVPSWQPKSHAIALYFVGRTTERKNVVSNDQTLS